MSAGYVISIVLSTMLMTLHGYQAAFLATASMTFLGWGLGHAATLHAEDQKGAEAAADVAFAPSMKRRSKLLTLGYIGHCWELFGAWAWIPAFLAAAVLSKDVMSPIELDLWTALALHLSGFFASFLSGYAADRFGADGVLLAFALVGAACSLSIGWLTDLNVTLLLVVAAVYGFATIGDSSVLSSAMTDAVPARYLGRALGFRSILGVGAGALSPMIFGLSHDLSPTSMAWGIAFSTLALGAILATLCALMLRQSRQGSRLP